MSYEIYNNYVTVMTIQIEKILTYFKPSHSFYWEWEWESEDERQQFIKYFKFAN